LAAYQKAASVDRWDSRCLNHRYPHRLPLRHNALGLDQASCREDFEHASVVSVSGDLIARRLRDRALNPPGGASSATEAATDATRPRHEQPQESPQAQSPAGTVKGFAEASAALLGSAALVGAGLDSVWDMLPYADPKDMLPYADPKEWIVAGLVLLGIGAGRQNPSLIGGK